MSKCIISRNEGIIEGMSGVDWSTKEWMDELIYSVSTVNPIYFELVCEVQSRWICCALGHALEREGVAVPWDAREFLYPGDTWINQISPQQRNRMVIRGFLLRWPFVAEVYKACSSNISI